MFRLIFQLEKFRQQAMPLLLGKIGLPTGLVLFLRARRVGVIIFSWVGYFQFLMSRKAFGFGYLAKNGFGPIEPLHRIRCFGLTWIQVGAFIISAKPNGCDSFVI